MLNPQKLAGRRVGIIWDPEFDEIEEPTHNDITEQGIMTLAFFQVQIHTYRSHISPITPFSRFSSNLLCHKSQCQMLMWLLVLQFIYVFLICKNSKDNI